jgi:hypothetical protein
VGWAAVATALVVGCGAAQDTSDAGKPTFISITPSDVTTKIVGGTPLQRKVLREVLAGIGPTRLEEVEITPSLHKDDSVGLVVPHDFEDLLAEWHTWLVAQGFAERSRELDLPVVSSLGDEPGAADGESLEPVPDRPTPTLSDAMRAAAAARKAAEVHGAEIERLEILKPNSYAFLVELRVEGDQARFLRDGLPRVLEFLGGPLPVDESTFTGDYTIVVDGDGKRVWEGAEAATGHQTGGALRADLVDCGPYLVFGPRRQRPRCQADEPHAKIIGATPKQETILREVLAGLGPTAIESLHVVPAGEWAPDDPTAVSARIEYAKTGDQNRSEWEAVLLAEAFAARSRSLHLPTVAAYETGDGGEALVEISGTDRAPVARDELKATVEKEAKLSGAELVDLHFVQPHGLAVAVTLRTDTPAEFLKRRLRGFLEKIPDPSHAELDGRYVRVVDADDRVVWAWARYPYGGFRWTRPDLEGCSPVTLLSVPSDWSPPACPAK